jgi:hypothetical protein
MVGRAGPHVISGVGFWAQQQYYNIFSVDSGPFIFRPIQRSLPEAWAYPPANAFQSWTWSYNLNLIGKDRLPVGEIIYDRPSEVPRPALSWAVNLLQNTLTPVTYPFTAFNQYDWPNPTPQPQPGQTWTWQYNLNLIGQDQLPIGDQRLDLAPIYPPYINDLRTWARSYNLNLIGRDRLPTGKQTYDLPIDQRPPWPTFLRSWEWRYNLNLIGKDQLPTGQQRYDLSPIWPPYINQLRTWSWSYNLNLIGQDRLPVGEQVWERPTLPIPPALTWLEGPQYELVAKPFAQYDWPNATPNYRIDQTWTWQYNLNLIGQDKLPTGQQTTDLPPRDFSRLLQTWMQLTNLALLTQPSTPQTTISQYFDRPQLPVPPARSWEWSYNLDLIGQDQLPFRQQDWPLTPRQGVPAELYTVINGVRFAIVKPFKQTDWPNPTPPARDPTLTSWAASYNKNLIGQDQLPAGAKSYDLAPRDYARILQTWIEQTNIALYTFQAGPLGVVFNKYDWPLTPAALPPALGWSWAYNLNLIGKDTLPKNQKDWPNPAGHTLPTLLQTWLSWRAQLFPAPQFPQGKQFFDRPQLRTDQPADQFFAWARYPIIPPPPIPTIGGSYRLLADHYLYGYYYKPNTIITEGKEVPIGWVPTLAVDPLDSLAVAAYYAAGPRNVDYGDLSTYTNMYKREFADVPVNSPITFWKQVPGTRTYQLMGLGIGNPPVGGM